MSLPTIQHIIIANVIYFSQRNLLCKKIEQKWARIEHNQWQTDLDVTCHENILLKQAIKVVYFNSKEF